MIWNFTSFLRIKISRNISFFPSHCCRWFRVGISRPIIRVLYHLSRISLFSLLDSFILLYLPTDDNFIFLSYAIIILDTTRIIKYTGTRILNFIPIKILYTSVTSVVHHWIISSMHESNLVGRKYIHGAKTRLKCTSCFPEWIYLERVRVTTIYHFDNDCLPRNCYQLLVCG